MPTILWMRTDGSGSDRAVMQDDAGGYRLAGTAIFAFDGVPYEIRYTILTDSEWRTRTVGAHAQMPDGDRRLALNADGTGSWFVGDDPVLDLYGAVDIDLGWTPATNSLAIRRLRLDVGETGETVVARVDFPSHEIQRVMQRYDRLDDHRYRYSSGDVSEELTVDGNGFVIDYPDGWRSIASAE